MREVLERDSDNIARAREARGRVSNAPLGLESPRPQPLVREGEALATMVVLPVVDPNRASVLEHRAVRRHAVWNGREKLHQVECGVGVMTDSEKEHLPVQIVHPTDRALGNVGWKRKRIGGDQEGLRSGRGEGVKRASRRASIRPSGPPSTGRAARKDVCTSRTPPSSTPSARS